MDQIVHDYFERMEFAASRQDLCDAITGAVSSLGFHSFAFLALSDDYRRPYLISTYPKAWTDCYIAMGYQARDPVVLHARSASGGFVWNPAMAESFGKGARDFFFEAATFGIRCGLTIPLPGLRHGSSAMSFATDRHASGLASCLRDHEQLLLFMAYHFRSRLRWMLEPVFLLEDVEITPRERECLEWAMRGKSRRDISQIMVISRRMVVRDLENVKNKLGVRTIGQAIAIYAAGKTSRTKLTH